MLLLDSEQVWSSRRSFGREARQGTEPSGRHGHDHGNSHGHNHDNDHHNDRDGQHAHLGVARARPDPC